MQLFTGSVTWDVKSAPTLWGPGIDVSIDFVEPCNKPATAKKNCPKRLRISKQPFAIGGMRLAYYAVTNEGHRCCAPSPSVVAFAELEHPHYGTVKSSAESMPLPSQTRMCLTDSSCLREALCKHACHLGRFVLLAHDMELCQ